MHPYETMLRRYRETARGLLGCFPAAARFHRRPPGTARGSLAPVEDTRLSTHAGVTATPEFQLRKTMPGDMTKTVRNVGYPVDGVSLFAEMRAVRATRTRK